MTSIMIRCLTLLCSTALFSLVLNAQIPTDGLVAYYPFDGDYNDSSSNNNHLTNHGAVLTEDRFGRLASAASFDRTSYLSVEDTFLPKNNSARTISFWIKQDGEQYLLIDPNTGNQAYTGIVISYGNTGTPFFGLGGVWVELWSDPTEEPGIRYLGKPGSFLHSPRNINEGGWHHIVYSFDGNTLRYFFNGQHVTTKSKDNFHSESDSELFIGGVPNSSLKGLNGAIDEVRIYDRPLRSSEIFQLYDHESAPPSIEDWIDDGLAAYYPFDEDAKDASGNGNDGQLVSTQDAVDRFGQLGGALRFIPDQFSSVTVDGTFMPSGYEPMTIAFWLRLENPALPEAGFTKYPILGVAEGQNSWNLNLIYQGNGVDFTPNIERFDMSGFRGAYSKWSLFNSFSSALRWHQIIISFRSSTEVDLYLDGIQTAWETLPTEATSFRNPGSLSIGASPGAPGGNTFSGSIDDLRIYNRALSSTEAAQLFDKEKPSSDLNGDDLVAYLPFDQNANDVTGNGHHGTVQGARLTEDRFGYPKSAYAFDGEDDVIIIPDDDALDFGFSDFTLTAWFKKEPFEKDVYSYVLAKYQPNEFPAYGMGVTQGERPFAFIGDGNMGNGIRETVSNREISENDWHFMAATYDRYDSLTIYIDGLRRAVMPVTSESLSLNNDHDLYIGNLSPGLGFKGAIDDVAIYNRLLTRTEIRELLVKLPFEIIQQPLGGTVGTGGAAILSVKLEGKGDFTYQWFKDSVELLGANTPSLVLSDVSYEDAGDYFVRITTSDGSLDSEPAQVVVEGPPLLVVQPVSNPLEVGQPFQLSVEALGTETFTYQWFFNGSPFVGAIDQTLFIPQASEALSGEYYVIVTNEYGEATSETAIVTVTFIDTDGDGIGDWREIEMGTNPESPDTDGDGLSDWVETEETGTNPVLADSDGDGLNDALELSGDTGYFTDPLVSDSDGDGLSDGDEVLRETYPTNPLVVDTDVDGLSDSEEIQLGINPTSEDTDGDGLGDADEVAYGYDPNEATEAPEGSLEIFRAVELRFFTLPGQTYQLHKSTDLETWEASGEPFVAEGGFYSTFARQEDEAVFWQLFRVGD